MTPAPSGAGDRSFVVVGATRLRTERSVRTNMLRDIQILGYATCVVWFGFLVFLLLHG